jgi:hypothetical protein
MPLMNQYCSLMKPDPGSVAGSPGSSRTTPKNTLRIAQLLTMLTDDKYNISSSDFYPMFVPDQREAALRCCRSNPAIELSVYDDGG